MKIDFTKMHGCGNDYIYINCLKEEIKDPNSLAKIMSPRHFSVGGDGIVLICKSDVADIKMRMFNLDGSEGKMCGNASRCIAKYVYDNNIVKKDIITLETLSGIKSLKIETDENDKVKMVEVDMGIASFKPEDIPLSISSELINAPDIINDVTYNITAVSMGNPHCVIYQDNIDAINLDAIGDKFENNPLFPERVNTEFIEIISPTHLKMRVWERGSGETYACGTGACAAVAASVRNLICPANEPITVDLVGGSLSIICKDSYRMLMKGPATKVYEGVFEYEDKA